MSYKKSNKILIIAQVPPPVHGASLMNEKLIYSDKINKLFCLNIVKLSFANDIADIGFLSFRKVNLMFKYFFKILLKLLVFRPNIVYFTITPTGNSFYRDVIFISLIKLFNPKIILHLHGKGIINNYSKSKTNKFLYNFVFKSSYVISLSEKLLLDIEYIKSKKKFIVNNGIEISKNQSSVNQSSKNKNTDKLQLLFLSNLLISKGIMTFLESIALLQKENKVDSNLYYVTIIGRNAEITSVEINDFIKKNNLININYLGPKYDDDKEKILNEKSILVFPSKNDAFPLVILEAMKYGIPVISSDEGGISDIIIEEKTGFIIEDINAEKIVNKVKYLIETPEKFDQMSENSIECFNSKFTLESFENNIINVFSEILKY